MIKSIKHYKSTLLNRDLMLKSTYKNVMETPNFDKITISLSHKEALINSNKLLIPLILIKLITGQKSKITKSKKSVSQFKLREGKAIGCKVNLRNDALYSFIDKFIFIILPQLLENQGKKTKINGNSINIGIEDISIFPELESQYELLRSTQGINITINLKPSKRKHYPFFSGIKIPTQYKKYLV